MLYIESQKITRKNIQDIYSLFARYEYEISDKIVDYIDGLMRDIRSHRYSSKRLFKRDVMDHVSGRRRHLTIMNLYRYRQRAYTIVMTGSRTGDFAAANLKAGLIRTPPLYTWHHAEGIRRVGKNYVCRMYLVLTKYHQDFPHKGGVAEYEAITGRKYH